MKDQLKFLICVGCVLIAGACASTVPTGHPEIEAVEPVETPLVEESGEAEAKELKNTLKWTTASEVENFGFDIFRSTSEDGTFECMTLEPLAGAGTVDEPQSYVWHDTTIEPGVDYYYYIESISLAGVRERFSPIIKSPAKI